MVVGRTLSRALGAVVIASVASTSFAVLWADNFNTAASAANWNVFASGSDFSVTFGYDYGAWVSGDPVNNPPIPSAPRSIGGATTGLRITVNETASLAQGVALFANSVTFSGNYKVIFDMWINYNGGAGGGTGSTEHATFGINSPTQANVWRGFPAGSWTGSAPTGLMWYAVSGEGGSSATSPGVRDYTVLNQQTLLLGDDGGYFATGTGREDHLNAYYQSLFPAPQITPGTPGKSWVTVEIEQLDGVTTWSMNGTPIASRASITTSGHAFIGYMDAFNSLASPAADNFIIYDNFEVVPEPGTLAAIAVGIGALAARRRRKR